MQIKSISFIGGGRISRILLKALKQKNALPDQVLVSDPDEEVISTIKNIDKNIIKTVKNNADLLNVDILFLSVHPPIVKIITNEIKGHIKPNTIVVSLIPVFSIEKLSGMLGGINKIVRMIPNAPSLIHKGYNPIAYSEYITADEKFQLQSLFNKWGQAPEVNEQKLEAYAIVTAMGPTYFWFQWLKLQELGKQFGLNDTELNNAIPAMLHGSIQTLFESAFTPVDVLDLIPVCPLKEEEMAIESIFDNKLKPLYAKLAQKGQE